MKFKAIDTKRRSTTIALGAALATPTSVWAQDIPSNAPALKILVGYPAGGGGDALVRTVSKKLGQVLQRSIVVDNKPGAGGTLAASLLANSPADGATVYMADSAILVATATQEKLGYDPQSLTPILGTGQLAYCVVVHPSFPARSVEELIQVLRASPGKYSYGSPGVGNIAHLAAEKFKKAAGVDMLHVPYKGGATAVNALLANAQEKNARLKYVAQLEGRTASVGLQEIPEGHDFYNLEGSDNIILFYTDRYSNQPLIVKGAGAGAAVTASGIFGDIIRIGKR